MISAMTSSGQFPHQMVIQYRVRRWYLVWKAAAAAEAEFGPSLEGCFVRGAVLSQKFVGGQVLVEIRYHFEIEEDAVVLACAQDYTL